MLAGKYFIEQAQRHGNQEFYSEVNISKISKTSDQLKPRANRRKGFLSIAEWYGKKLAQCMYWHLKNFWQRKTKQTKKKNKTTKKKKKNKKNTTKTKSSKVTHYLLPFFINQFSYCHKCLKTKLFWVSLL